MKKVMQYIIVYLLLVFGFVGSFAASVLHWLFILTIPCLVGSLILGFKWKVFRESKGK
jgi:hypothetical protein